MTLSMNSGNTPHISCLVELQPCILRFNQDIDVLTVRMALAMKTRFFVWVWRLVKRRHKREIPGLFKLFMFASSKSSEMLEDAFWDVPR